MLSYKRLSERECALQKNSSGNRMRTPLFDFQEFLSPIKADLFPNIQTLHIRAKTI